LQTSENLLQTTTSGFTVSYLTPVSAGGEADPLETFVRFSARYMGTKVQVEDLKILVQKIH